MSGDEVLDKSLVNKFFKYARMQSNNKRCADCSNSSPIWVTVTYGFFICTECAAKHRELGVGITKVKSTILDTWSLSELRRVYVSGNSNAPKLGKDTDLRAKYTKAKWYSDAVSELSEKNKEDEPGISFIENLTKRSERALEPRKVEEKKMPKFSDSNAKYVEEKNTMSEKQPDLPREPRDKINKPVAIRKNSFPSLQTSQTEGFNVEDRGSDVRKLGFGALKVQKRSEDNFSSEQGDVSKM
ncbi:putative ARF GTPase activating protein [Encephalitozoon intestinalis ATCC 50506]|uniref:ARF GTPase activating protein n=1 Tax=Encephalitozoon intestinalis (strain ATCC 50506) TaxID=876142 RepID=E0S8R0_ENCIT|nr:putative ARF GTPase activating protein [Encephalitozoon intestinalis ATCC 50506]ADM12098.1 putative ARF GTPase activating protein [Encephalitozoon intestinalis ATCC 50506]UTX45891.1 putative Arf GTPase activating protein [Encephalitozoon intestinalis]